MFDGVMFGLAGRTGSAHLGFGLVLRLGEELSPGFRMRVATAVADYPEELKLFAGVCPDVECESTQKVDKRLDGFPLHVAGRRLFPGNPIISSVNKSLFVGVFVPFSLRELFQ